jgi:hypothetical protein
MDMVFRLIEIYDLVDPITDDAIGSFTDPELDALYDTLVSDGEVSLIAALTVGATIEDMDLADLYDLLATTDNDHIEIVAYNLAKGSRNHLRAFMRALEAQDATYTPGEYLDPVDFYAILEADMERRTFFNADGEPVPACGAEVGGFDIRRGINGNSGNGSNGGQNNGSGSGTGECDGTGSTDGGNGPGTGECDGSGSTGGSNGNGGGGN